MKPSAGLLFSAVGLILGALTHGCGPTQPATDRQLAVMPATPTTAPPAPTTEPVPPAETRGTTPVEDRSLTAAEYLKLGLPADDRPWSSVDFAKAHQIFVDVAKKDARELPRYGSTRSGKLFARLTANENLGLARDTTLPLSARFPECLSYTAALNAISKLYMAAFLEKRIGGVEMIELMAHSFQVHVVMADLVNEFIPTIPKDDPSYATRMAGLQKMKQGVAISVNGALIMLTEQDGYSAKDRTRFAESLTVTLPRLVPQLREGSRAETVQTLETMSADSKLKDLQPALGKLRDAVKKAATDAK